MLPTQTVHYILAVLRLYQHHLQKWKGLRK